MILNYQPLVTLMVLNPEGRMVEIRYMNEDFLDKFPQQIPPSEAAVQAFSQFLSAGRKKALAKNDESS